MEITSAFTFSGRNVPPEIEERYNKWYDAAYVPLYMKTGDVKGIDRYKIIRKSYAMPGDIHFYHAANLETLKKRFLNPDRNAVIRDQQTTFGTIERFWFKAYELMKSFRNLRSAQEPVQSTIVDDTPVIHIEGYKLPETDYSKFESWFSKWASRFYIPLLLKVPGVKAVNFLVLADYRDPIYDGVRFVETDMPRYMSIIYFDNTESADNFNQSAEFAVFKRSLEVEFSGSLKTVWDTEYSLFKSYRPPE